jgi:predicted phosphodiesterase
MTTCLAIGDPHFQVNNVVNTEELIKKVSTLVKKVKPTFVVILGDLLHTHEKIHVTPFNLATRFITELARRVPVFLIIGNHDYCLAEDTPVLMWDGSTKMSQDVKVGDQLIGDDSKPRTVKNLVRGQAPMYKISQKMGMNYTVTGNHTLVLKCGYEKSCIWDATSRWIVKWFDSVESKCQTEFFKNRQEADEFLQTIPDPDTIELTVNEYLRLEPDVRRHLYGYNCRDSVQTQISVTEAGVQRFYGWELAENHRFLLGDYTVTHNCNNQQFLTDRHAFNSFKSIKNVIVCDRVVRQVINDKPFIFCPYVPPERFEEALDTVEGGWDDARCIFAHQEFYGCRFNPIMTSTEGDIWPEEYPFVISGHIHDSQQLQENIYYTGSSMQHAFGESANKTVALLTFKGSKGHKLQKIDLEMRKKKIVYLGIKEVKGFKIDPDTDVKLVLKGTPEEFKVFRRSTRYKELQSGGVKVSFFPTVKIDDAKGPIQKKSVLDILEEMIKKENKYTREAFSLLKKKSLE